MFVDICSSILTVMSAVVLLQYTLTCFYCSLHCMLSCYCFDPSVDLLHAYIRAVIIMHLLIECHTCYMYCTEASAPFVLHCKKLEASVIVILTSTCKPGTSLRTRLPAMIIIVFH